MANRPKKRTHSDLPNQAEQLTSGAVKERSAPLATNQKATCHFPVVGIVASAGGLDAFKKFFSAMPLDCGMAFVLVPHLSSQRKSMVAEILAKQTTMPVAAASDGMPVAMNCVYVIPPNHFLAITDCTMRLSPLPETIGKQVAIDFFLRSLAEDQRERAIGIVLSGTGSHGTLGLRDIKRCGGMAIAQDPESAEFEQMPRSAIETGIVDLVISPELMPKRLVDYVRQPYVNRSPSVLSSNDNASEQLAETLVLVFSLTKCDFRMYRPNMLMRRIDRRMGLLQFIDFATYLDFLRVQPDEVHALCKDFQIGVTAFFRDPESFDILAKELIPSLVEQQCGDLPIRVWVPGCATGEEAYSIAILLLEAFETAGKPAHIQVFASDINEHSIEVGRRGIYPASIANDVSEDRLQRFFVASNDSHYRVNKVLRDSIVFSKQNLISDAPFSKLNLISCKNLMIYFEPETQQRLVSMFHYGLIENGCLMLGPAETIRCSTNLFDAIENKWRFYRRVGVAKTFSTHVADVEIPDRQRMVLPKTPDRFLRNAYKELTESVVQDFSPAVVLINRDYQILYVSGPIVDFLEFPTGEITKDLLVMSRKGLRTDLRRACESSLRDRVTVTVANARVQQNGGFVPCAITVRPAAANDREELLVVVFQDCVSQPVLQPHEGPASEDGEAMPTMSSPIQLLESELEAMHEELQNSMEAMEDSNEDLQSSNEELVSSKEELQSLNEELSSVNGELLDKVGELDRSNTELKDLMASTEVATLFLDKDLRIKRFTSATLKIFNLVPTDEGRLLSDFASRIVENQLLDECKQVLDQQVLSETEIYTDDLRCYLRRILPFRTSDHRTDGIVITFIDLTERKLAETSLRESQERTLAIVNTASEAIISIGYNGIIDSVNHATESMFGYTAEELVGHDVCILMSLPFPRESDGYMQRIFNTCEPRFIGVGREVVCKRNNGSVFPADLALSQIESFGLFTCVLRDVSNERELQKHILEIAADEQRRIGYDLHDGTQQELTGLTLYASALLESLQNASHIEAERESASVWQIEEADYQRLEESASLLSKRLVEAHQHVRDLAHGIMPVQIDAEGLRSALSELANLMSSNEKISCRFECMGNLTILNNTTATHLYRIAQEAISNSLRHGSASKIQISLYQEDERITLEICDNGSSAEAIMSDENAAVSRGMGLRTMKYRASMIGGIIQFEPRPEGGILVRCTILGQGSL